MRIDLHDPADSARLDTLVADERLALQRDRYRAVRLATRRALGNAPCAWQRAVRLAMDSLEGDEIARRLGRSPRFVDEWAARYRRGGIENLVPRKQPGRTPKLTPEQEEQLKTRLDAGPLPEDGVCVFHGADVCRIIEREFGVVHTLGGIYDVLRRLGYSSLMPRPRHRENDPEAAERFKQQAPLLSSR